jgi:hypothetical protein
MQYLCKISTSYRKKNRYIFSIFATLYLCKSIAENYQYAGCVPEGSRQSRSTIGWALRDINNPAQMSLILDYQGSLSISQNNYMVVGNSLVFVKGENQNGEKFIFFNNNWQYNVKSGDYQGPEDLWTFFINGKHQYMSCYIISGNTFPNRNIAVNIHGN